MVYEVSPSKDKEIVLDVGAGRIPSSSIWLGEKVKKVASIDCEFYISGEALEEMNVEATEAYFDKFTSVDGYTFVVGRCPCTAIKYMVQKCANANIPYLIKLCDCDIVAAQRYINKANSWDTVLLGYDENVKFYKDYAYNLVDDKYGIYEEMSDIIDMEINNITISHSAVCIVIIYNIFPLKTHTGKTIRHIKAIDKRRLARIFSIQFSECKETVFTQ